jgi:acyl carrier protein
LTQRTNQFNFTTIRRSESELRRLLSDAQVECLVARVSDRFGDYGLTGVVITRNREDVTEVDTFLLSCRILGRGVEHRILAEIARRAIARGQKFIRLRVMPSAKNLPAREFLESVLNGTAQAGADPGTVDAASLTGIRYKPSPAPAAPASRPSSPTARKFVDFAAIARDLSTPTQILEAMRRERNLADIPPSGPSTTVSRLAAIWRDLLGSSHIALSDNFFDIGGHSLLAVLLIVRVKEDFGIELPVEDVYSPAMTLENLALKIETYRLSGVSPGEYADLVAQIEQLSDEEAERLLREELQQAEPQP